MFPESGTRAANVSAVVTLLALITPTPVALLLNHAKLLWALPIECQVADVWEFFWWFFFFFYVYWCRETAI